MGQIGRLWFAFSYAFMITYILVPSPMVWARDYLDLPRLLHSKIPNIKCTSILCFQIVSVENMTCVNSINAVDSLCIHLVVLVRVTACIYVQICICSRISRCIRPIYLFYFCFIIHLLKVIFKWLRRGNMILCV